MEFVDTKKSDGNENNCENSTTSEVNMETTKTTDDLNDNKLENSTTTTTTTPTSTSTLTPAAAEETENKKINETTKECIDFKVIYSKKKIDINFPLDGTIDELKGHLENIISVPKTMQKIMIKGLAKDEQTLRNLGVTNNAKVMIVGSKLDDVLALTVPSKQELQDADNATASATKEPLSKQTIHRKILDKGVPDDAMPGILGSNDPLPDFPLSGMVNKRGGKVRLTFKLEQDQLWIGTKERTEKISMSSIKGVINEPIAEKPQYHIMAIQLGPTEASRYFIYWVPSQFIGAIKDAILGKWGYF